jgi:signal transduction histidine kinase
MGSSPVNGSSRGERPLSLWAKALLALAFWSGLGLLFSTQIYFLSPDGSWIAATKAAMPRWYAWGLLTPLLIATDRRLLRRRSLRLRLALHLPLGLLFALAVEMLRYGAEVAFTAGNPEAAFSFILRGAYWDILIYGLIVGLYIAWDLAAEAQQRQLREAQLESHLAEAHLRTLRAQLRPHFLFNALNTISAYTETDPRVARRMMAHLGALLRASLDHADGHEVTLERELTLLDNYLAIEMLRFEGRLTVDICVQDPARDALVPVFLLQPLVENAIRHGINAQMRGGHVRVHARRGDGWLFLAVEDSGIGLPAGWRLDDHAGVGLMNTTRRLEELYGADHKFQIEGAPSDGVRVQITLPYRAEDGATPQRQRSSATRPSHDRSTQ